MKSKLFSLLLLVLSFVGGYFVGSHEFYMAADINHDGSTTINYPHWYNVKDVLKYEREYCAAWIELCHYYLYDNNPSICGECDDIDSYHNTTYWDDVVSESKYYDKLYELNGGDWEDFYCYWN